MHEVSGTTAIVTGAAQGIGLAVARRLAADGHYVALVDVQSDPCSRQAEAIRADGGCADAFRADVSQSSDVNRLFQRLDRDRGSVDILVNNAAIMLETPIEDISESEWDQVLAVNLKGAFLCSQRALPLMRRRRWGRIINLSSIAGQAGSRIAGAHYAVSKTGLVSLAKMFALAGAPDGITANAVAPGPTRTPQMDRVNQEVLRRVTSTVPVGRVGQSDEIAAAVSFLCSDDAGFITGATIDINGGLYLR